MSFRPALEVVAQSIEPAFPGRANPVARLLARSTRRSPVRARSRGLPWNAGVARAAVELRQKDIRRSLLTPAEAAVRELFRDARLAQPYLARIGRAERAHEAAKTRFVTANLRLVVHMTRRYAGGPMPREDLVQEGNFGLIRAVERFDYRRGLRFSTYATWWIRHHMNRAIADKGRLIRLPTHALESIARVARARAELLARDGAIVSTAALAQAARVKEDAMDALQESAQLEHTSSLDVTAQRHGGRVLHESVADLEQPGTEREFERGEPYELVMAAMRELSAFEAAILRFRFGLDGGNELTLKEIGDKYDLSRERIRQIEASALDKLRDLLRGMEPRPEAVAVSTGAKPYCCQESARARSRAPHAPSRGSSRCSDHEATRM